MTTKSFQDILAWQHGHAFVLEVYKITTNFPAEEKFGIVSQFRRAAVSITANISEGYRKLSKADKLRFLNISQGSLEECRNYIILSRDLGFLNQEGYSKLTDLIEKTSWFLNAYSNGIEKNKGITDSI